MNIGDIQEVWQVEPIALPQTTDTTPRQIEVVAAAMPAALMQEVR